MSGASAGRTSRSLGLAENILSVSSRWRSPSGQRQRPGTAQLELAEELLELFEDGRTLEELRQAGQTL